MPIFEYKCQECGTQFEKITSPRTDPVECKFCHSQKLEKMVSPFAISGGPSASLSPESGQCGCGAPRRGMCGE